LKKTLSNLKTYGIVTTDKRQERLWSSDTRSKFCWKRKQGFIKTISK